jgi:hypothetical protein
VSLGRGVPVLFSIPVVEDVEVFNKKFKMRQALALRELRVSALTLGT